MMAVMKQIGLDELMRLPEEVERRMRLIEEQVFQIRKAAIDKETDGAQRIAKSLDRFIDDLDDRLKAVEESKNRLMVLEEKLALLDGSYDCIDRHFVMLIERFARVDDRLKALEKAIALKEDRISEILERLDKASAAIAPTRKIEESTAPLSHEKTCDAAACYEARQADKDK
ncbi:MAG: hypothetical protein LBO00_03390 [Zoogloeaceae bacterium]|jgi:chromosome segregation ATPase|nr:hypothetical protein [Zoogloeaceae bacterium]